MGGSVSAGKNNDELIDHLVEAEFIRTPQIQQVFRAVDRGNYYCPDQRDNAYRDIAWRMGNLHLSAPCVYSEVMEALKLRPGLSFLNLGSGSGYLSTMAGLILGPYGINHGIELYSDIVDFAYERLDEFIGNSNAVDEYDFCEPSFVVGNCLMLDSSCQQYDRVYCGASCPEEYEAYVKNLVKIGGILIMPLNEKLLKITRTGETTWSTAKVLSVSFAPLIAPPPSDCTEHIKLGNICPPKLKHICRSNIRAILRKNIDKENPNLKNKQRRVEAKHRRQVRRIVIPIFDESDLSNHSQSNSEFECDSDSPEFTISSRIPSRMSVLLEDFLRRHAELQALSEAAGMQTESHTDSSDSDSKQADNSEEKEDSDSKIDSENSELTYSASFISMSDKSVATSKPKSTSTTSEKSSSSGNQTTFSNFKKSVNRFNKSPCPHSSKTDETRRKIFSKRKRPASDDQGASSSSAQIRARVKRRAATVVWKRIIPRDSDSEMEEESKNNCAKTNDDDTYTKHMVKRIADLPLPTPLLRYLNYRRNNM